MSVTRDTVFKFILLIIQLSFSLWMLTHFVPSGAFHVNGLGVLYKGIMVTLLIVLLILYDKPTRTEELIFHSLITVTLLTIVSAIYAYVAPYTPHAAIDPTLVKWDRILHLSVLSTMQLSEKHHWLQAVIIFVYNSVLAEIYFILIILAFLGQARKVREMISVLFLGYVIVSFFYFFYPSLTPAATLHSNLFSNSEHQIVEQFYLTHHHSPLAFHNLAFLGFPSFHVFWACTLIYYSRVRRGLFYALLPINLLVMPATMMTGWHYGVDVIAGVAFFFMMLALQRCVIDKLCRTHEFNELPALWVNYPLLAPAMAECVFLVFAWAFFVLTVLFEQAFIMVVYFLFVLAHCLLWRKRSH